MTPALAVLLSIIGVGVLLENAVATRLIIRDEFSSFSQKIGQILFVWLVPLLGAPIVIWLTRGEVEKAPGCYPSSKEIPDETPAVSQPDYSSD